MGDNALMEYVFRILQQIILPLGIIGTIAWSITTIITRKRQSFDEAILHKRLDDIEYKLDLIRADGENEELMYRLDTIEKSVREIKKE